MFDVHVVFRNVITGMRMARDKLREGILVIANAHEKVITGSMVYSCMCTHSLTHIHAHTHTHTHTQTHRLSPTYLYHRMELF